MDFYEKVQVRDNASAAEYIGKTGVIGGMSDGADGKTYYAVNLDGDDVVMFAEDELVSLGGKASDAYPGGSVKVSVDEDGHAEIIEDNPPQSSLCRSSTW